MSTNPVCIVQYVISSPVTDIYLSEIKKNTMKPGEFKIGRSGAGWLHSLCIIYNVVTPEVKSN